MKSLKVKITASLTSKLAISATAIAFIEFLFNAAALASNMIK